VAFDCDINDSRFTIHLESVDHLAPNHDAVRTFQQRLDALEAVSELAIDKLEFKVKAAGVAPQGPYKYELTLSDGRHWEQAILFTDRQDTDPHVSFDIAAPGFLTSTFAHTIPLREAVQELHHLTVDKILVTRL